MNTVKVYVICKNDEELKWCKEQCDYIRIGGENGRRKGGLFNVKYVVHECYEKGFLMVQHMIADHQFFEFGLVLFGNYHLNRRLWSVINELAIYYHGKCVKLLISSASSDFDTTRKVKESIQIIADELVPKHFLIQTFCDIEIDNLPVPCFVSKSFIRQGLGKEKEGKDDDTITFQGIILPHLCIGLHLFNKSSCEMFLYCPKREESIFNQLFDAVYCINLSSRSDRLQEFAKRAKAFNIKFEVYSAVSKTYLNPLTQMVMPDDSLLDGSANKSGLLGCLLSHLNVMKIALSRKQEQILIFEDDVSFHKDAPLLLKNFVESCKQLSLNFKDLNIIHLGYLPVVKKGNLQENDVWSYRYLEHANEAKTIVKSKHFIATHAYVINSKFMKAYIDFYANYSTDAEEWITNDWAIRNHFLESKDFVCYSPCPQICAIKPTMSDNSGLSDDDIEIRLTNTFYTYFDDYE
jgi:GR25 family glycosyltransferase involved in LPS biosynthesis